MPILNKPNTRLYNLDYVRGIAAFFIMLYHFLDWNGFKYTSSDFFGRIGLYGVAIFYILSGLTLYHVYFDRLEYSIPALLDFAKKRILRIFPLLWLASISSIIFYKFHPSFLDLFLNFTGLFGFFKWDTYFATGAWSIGNELVFYAFFPVFLFLLKYNRIGFFLFSLIIFTIGGYFAFFKLKEALGTEETWKIYVNPLNQVFLFLTGIIIGHYLKNKKINQITNLSILSLAILLFVFYPTNGASMELTAGLNRIIFSSLCAVIITCFYKLELQVPNFLHKPLTILGETSYSVYLLHPLVYTVVVFILKFVSKSGYNFNIMLFTIPISLLGTIFTSYAVYEYYEKFFIKFGKKSS